MNNELNNFGMNNMNITNAPFRTQSNISTYCNPLNNNLSQTNGLNNNMSTNNIIWVQGIEGAKAWQLNPNSMAILLDSEIEGKMYIKVSDNIGMSSLRVFNYTEETPVTTNSQFNIDLSQYVKKDELASIIKEVLAGESTVSTTSTNNITATTVDTSKQQSEPTSDVFAKL